MKLLKDIKMWANCKITATILVAVTIGLACVHQFNVSKKVKKLNELTSSMALDLFFILRDLDAGNVSAAREKTRKSLEITNQIRIEENLSMSHWTMYDYYVNK